MSQRYWNKKVLLAKTETTYGTDAAPTGARAVHAVTGEAFPGDGGVRAEAVVSEPLPDDGEPF